ncbi:hypothetical protein [uncultured Winogradskyella sp.]|uniref:hypothetical protein n=1 Tax=uncultured Winogradskyella sp. TaxID=395353 RepID=UPI002633520E|nr:hypothetical protein [uncultured Winogradskyella sp.]
MKSTTKATILSFIIFAIIFLSFRVLLSTFFDFQNRLIPSVVSAVVASVLSPRRTIIKKQSGKEVQLKWVFSKKIISIK